MPDKSLMTRLRAVSAVTTLVGGSTKPRVRCGHLDGGDSLPGVVLRLDTVRPVNHSTGTEGTEFANVMVDCIADTYSAARGLTDAVDTAISGWSNTGGTPSISMVHVLSRSYNPGPVRAGEDELREIFTLDCLVQYR